MAPVELVALITPKPGKAQRFLELFAECAEYVQANEPYIFKYELHKAIPEQNGGKELFIVFEGYESPELQAKHMGTPPVVKLLKALETEDLTETKLVMTTPGPGIKPKI